MKIKNKNDIILLSIVLFVLCSIIVSFVFIFNIWNKKNDENYIGRYSYSGFEENVVSRYQKEIEKILKKDKALYLVGKLNDEYLKSINLTKDKPYEVINYLNKQNLLSSSPTVTEYSYSIDDSTGIYIYDFTYDSNGYNKKVYIIEEEPYKYTISFDQEYIPKVAKEKVTAYDSGIEFELTLLESKSNSVKYNLKITNNSTNVIKFDFNNVSSVELNLEDGSYIKLASVVASNEEDYYLNKNSYFNQELFFSIPIDKQSKIDSIILYNVLIGEEKKIIKIDF